MWQLWVPSAHSSMSRKQTINNIALHVQISVCTFTVCSIESVATSAVTLITSNGVVTFSIHAVTIISTNLTLINICKIHTKMKYKTSYTPVTFTNAAKTTSSVSNITRARVVSRYVYTNAMILVTVVGLLQTLINILVE